MADYAYSNDDGLTFSDPFDSGPQNEIPLDQVMPKLEDDWGIDYTDPQADTTNLSTDVGELVNKYTPEQQAQLLAALKEASVKPQVSTPGDPAAPNSQKSVGTLDSISKLIGGDKGVAAALVQAGFGMLSGASQGKMLEKKYEIEKQRRDEEWARKDKNSYAGNLKRKTGLLGTAVK